MDDDLFSRPDPTPVTYTANDIEVLEGLEPVRRRPAMYIGGTDERALHHLVAELLDNAVDEAVAGHATRIELHLAADGSVTVRDNGRGIPVDPHPKFPDRSALEVILTTLHSGGKFGGERLRDLRRPARRRPLGRQRAGVAAERRGRPRPGAVDADATPAASRRDRCATPARCRTGGERPSASSPIRRSSATDARFRPGLLYRMARSKAYLFRGMEIRWSCPPELLDGDADVPAEAVLHFPGRRRRLPALAPSTTGRR